MGKLLGFSNYLFALNNQAIMEEERKQEQYKKEKTLGVGACGTAYLVLAQNAQKLMVVKEINMKNMDDESKKGCLREAKIMEKLSHPNIVKSYEVYKTKTEKLCIVMESADAGDLDKLI